MPIAARHRTDPVPPLTPLPDLVVRQETDAGAMAVLQKRMPEEMAQRFEQARDPMHAGTITNGGTRHGLTISRTPADRVRYAEKSASSMVTINELIAMIADPAGSA